MQKRKRGNNHVLTLFHNGKDEVVLKARGRSISRAVDVAEIVRNRFVPEAKPVDIKIGTEPISAEQGSTINVSTIEITLKKE
ncbi:MAG: DNA-binding protein Alba [Candidatus Freyarchaeota archaeon]